MKTRRMQAYLCQFERPPPNRLVTRRLECESKYDDCAWSDSHWQETIRQRNEIEDTLKNEVNVEMEYFANDVTNNDLKIPIANKETHNWK